MFGRSARLPVVINADNIEDPSDRVKNYDELASPNQSSNRISMEAEIKANIQRAQEKQKKHYDRIHGAASCFSVGSMVLKKDFRRQKRKGGKLDYRWEGPYLITASLGKGLFQLKNPETDTVLAIASNSITCTVCLCVLQLITRVNGFHLKEFYKSADSDDFSDDSLYDFQVKRIKTLSPLVITHSYVPCSQLRQ